MLTPNERAELQGLLEHGSPTEMQANRILAVLEHGSSYKASQHYGDHKNSYEQSIHQVKKKAAKQGWSPEHDMTKTAPETHLVKGTSTLYNDEGGVKLQWVKTNLKNEDKLQQMQEFAVELIDEVQGRAKKTKAPKVDAKDRLTVYPMGDPHIGMYAWGEEAGEDFDVDVAVSDLTAATQRLVDSSPASEQAIILNLGDFFHADNQMGVTSRSGQPLDTDTRWARVMKMGAAAMKSCIESALQKHKQVWVRNCIGNHDDHTSHALALILEAYYSKEPRVHIEISPNPFWYFRFGKNLIGSTHGHSVKPQDLSTIMAHDKPEDWGASEFRYWYLGHYHTQRVHEYGTVVVEYFRTLAAKDAWTNAAGYRSGRDMNSIILHKEYGQIERHRADIVMVRS